MPVGRRLFRGVVRGHQPGPRVRVPYRAMGVQDRKLDGLVGELLRFDPVHIEACGAVRRTHDPPGLGRGAALGQRAAEVSVALS